MATDRELILVLLEEGQRAERHARVLGLLRRLPVTIEVDFGRGWLAAATHDAKAAIRAHRDVMVAGGVYQRAGRAFPRRTRRLANE